MTSRMAWLLGVGATLPGLLACIQCREDEVREGNACVRLCNSDAECGDGRHCENGRCLEGARTESGSSSGLMVDSSSSAGNSSAGSGGSSGAGGESCLELLPGCGADGQEDCCETIAMPGGTYNRLNNGLYPATVSPFRLDRFEVTVGRFRNYTDALPAGPRDLLRAALACPDGTWTDTPEDKEFHPISCVLRGDAIAFCAWDQGRLPTEAEWNFAAAGGDQQRHFPWSNPPESTALHPWHAVYDTTSAAAVGSRTAGAGRWGHLDLAGNVFEIVLDLPGSLPVPCVDCVNQESQDPSRLIQRGSGWKGTAGDAGYRLSNTWRDSDPDTRIPDRGFRCAR